jgi:hypothetical protein
MGEEFHGSIFQAINSREFIIDRAGRTRMAGYCGRSDALALCAATFNSYREESR